MSKLSVLDKSPTLKTQLVLVFASLRICE